MNFTDVFANPLWRAWAETLLHFVWQGALLGLIAPLCVSGLRLRTASARYVANLAALLLMAACVPGTFAILVSRADQNSFRTQDETAAVRREPPAAAADVASNGDTLAGLDGVIATVGAPEFRQDSPSSMTGATAASIYPWMLTLWGLGVALFTLRIAASWVGTGLMARHRAAIPPAVLENAGRLAQRLGLRRVPGIFASPRIGDAAVVGFLKPIVLLPAAWLTELPTDMLEAVLAHELAHIRRHDVWVNLMQRVIETVLFYHPAVWWVSRRLRAEREMCCDELAISVTHQRLVYVTALESVARHRAGLVKPAVAVTLGDQDMALLKRVQHVLGLSPAAASPGWWPVAMVALTLPVCLWLGWGSLLPNARAEGDGAAGIVGDSESSGDEADDRADSREPELVEARDSDEDRRDADEGDEDRDAADDDRDEDREIARRPPPDGPPPPQGRRDDRDGDDRREDEFRGGPRRRRVRDRDEDDRRGPPPRDEAARPQPGPRDGDRREGPPGAGFGRGIRHWRDLDRPRGREVEVEEEDERRIEVRIERRDNRPGSDAPRDEVVRLLGELRREVEQLRHEVRELREQRRPGRPEGEAAERRDGPPPRGRRWEIRREVDERRGPGRDEDRPEFRRGREPRGPERGMRREGPRPDDRPDAPPREARPPEPPRPPTAPAEPKRPEGDA